MMQVSASDASAQMSGYLRMLVRRSWRRGWFVLKDRVIYEYRAPQDVLALYSLPVLGYQVDPINKVSMPHMPYHLVLALLQHMPLYPPFLLQH